MTRSCKVTLPVVVVLSAFVTLADSTFAAVGRTAGEGNASTSGEANYVIPITVPSGINGLTPDLAFVYGHRQKEGLAGVGWNISGLSEINRCTKTEAQDGVSDTVKLETTDRLCFGGSQLRLMSGSYGIAGSTYRTEVDTVARFTANGTAGNGPAWLKVEDKNGLIYEYGNSTDSRIESLTNYFTTTAITWALNKIKDRQGNEIVFAYAEDGAPYGSHRIESISYRGNPGLGVSPGYFIDFVYENQPSADVDTKNAAGSTIEDIKRLTRVDVLYIPTAPDVIVRRYQLAYQASLSSASRSRLTSIQECAGAPLQCLAATTFTYQNGTNSLAAEVSSGSTVPAGTKPLAIDINGDGRTDLAYPSSAAAGTWYYRLANASGGYAAAVNSGIANTNHGLAIAFDHNSDGLDDILVPYSGSTWWAIKGSASGLVVPVNTLAPLENGAGDAAALDRNGDGRDDLVYRLGATGGIYVRYRAASGNGFSATPTAVVGSSLMYQVQSPVFEGVFNQNRTSNFDANGDGLKDVGVRIRERMGGHGDPVSFVHEIKIVLGGAAGTFQASYDAYPMNGGLPIDMNGDGYTDIVFDQGVGSVLYRLSTGKSFGGPVPGIGPPIGNLDMTKAIAFDWDSDGYQDLLLPNTSTNTWHYLRSLGESFANPVNTGVSANGAKFVYRTDSNGDGLDDIGYVRSTGAYAHIPHAGVTPDLLATATDGNANKITYTYAALPNSTVYTKGTSASFPEQDYIGPIIVVKTAAPSTGIDSGTYTLTYKYWAALMNLEGRGLAGFDKRTIHDSRNGVTVSEYFERDFPFRGRLRKRELRLSDNTLVQEVTNTWASKSGGSGIQSYHFPYVEDSVEKNYEAGGTYNGAQLNEITTTTVVDAYGTPTNTTTVTVESSSANGVLAGATYTEEVQLTTITNNAVTWCLGKPGQIELINSHNQTYGTQITRTVTQSWDTNVYCRLDQEVTEPSSSTYKVTRAIGYDGFGNIDSETITGVGMAARTTTTSFGATGQFPVSVTNPLNQIQTAVWDAAKGVKSSETDPNGLAASWQHDVFGRKTRETRVDATYTDFTLTSCTSANSYCGTSYSRVKTQVHASSKRTNGSEIRYDDLFLDKFDREVQSQRQMMNGAVSTARTIYDAIGRVSQRSMPDFSPSPSYYRTMTYDVLNRITQVSRPVDAGNLTPQTVGISYLGLQTITTDPEGMTSTRISDTLDRTVRSIDDSGYYQRFDYDAFGSLRRVLDSQSNSLQQLTYVYGIQPFRLTSNDMDMGLWTYAPNALGEVIAYTDAKAQSFSATFDKLSRPLTRTEAGNSTTWVWGNSAAAHNIGRLASVSTSGHSESYTYDTKGRISQRTTVADATYVTNYAYDSTSGLLDALTYPTSTASYRLKLKYAYGYGILNKVSDFAAPTTVFWEATSVDARGNVLQDALGNGLETIRGFDAVTGRPDYILAGPGGDGSRQDMEFSWNKVGSLTQRKDLNRSLTEDFSYDGLHRLASSTLNGVLNLDVDYDAMGNIVLKTDVHATATWTYHATKKHAVANAGGNTFTYDANGNQITRNANDVVWTSYNYPSRIENGSKYHDFYYDANRQRWKQVYYNGSASETTIFVGGILEKRTAASVTEYRHYIRVGKHAVALYTRPTSGAVTTQYFLLDHLGSVAEITNGSGGVDVGENFTAFGERRDPTDWSGSPSAGDITAIGGATQRGFTFHTNAESSSLVHMNGRVADGLTGRFLSADPYIPNAGITQSFNRYSYVRNNPLTFTDPSGFCEFTCATIISSVFGTIGDFLFGSSPPPPPPKGCWVSAQACHGKAGSSKLFDIVSDILKTPGSRMADEWENIWRTNHDSMWGSVIRSTASTGSSVGISASRNILAGSIANTKDDSRAILEKEFQKQLLNRLKDEAERVVKEHRNVSPSDFERTYGWNRVFTDMDLDAMRRFASRIEIGRGLDNLVQIGMAIATRGRSRVPDLVVPDVQFDLSGWVGACNPKNMDFAGHCGFYDPDMEFHDINDILPDIMKTPRHN